MIDPQKWWPSKIGFHATLPHALLLCHRGAVTLGSALAFKKDKAWSWRLDMAWTQLNGWFFACLNTKSEKFSFKIANSSGLTFYRAHETQTPWFPWSGLDHASGTGGTSAVLHRLLVEPSYPSLLQQALLKTRAVALDDREQPLANYHLEDPMVNGLVLRENLQESPIFNGKIYGFL